MQLLVRCNPMGTVGIGEMDCKRVKDVLCEHFDWVIIGIKLAFRI